MDLSHALESYTESPKDTHVEVGADRPLRFQCWSRGLQRLIRVRNTETVSRKYITGSREEPADPQRLGAYRPRGLQINRESLIECGTGHKSYAFIPMENLSI